MSRFRGVVSEKSLMIEFIASESLFNVSVANTLYVFSSSLRLYLLRPRTLCLHVLCELLKWSESDKKLRENVQQNSVQYLTVDVKIS